MDIETRLKVEDWQRKCLDGSITAEDMAQAIDHLRAGRERAVVVGKIKKEKATKTKVAAKTSEDLLKGLETLLGKDDGNSDTNETEG